MNLPALAVNDRAEDFEWFDADAPTPLTRIEQIPSPVAAVPVSADEFAKRLDEYWDKILKIPDWHEQLTAKAAAAKEARLAERRQRKANRRAA